MSHLTAAAVTVQQTLRIACPMSEALALLQDARQWLPWAIPGLSSVQPLPFGQWLLKLPWGLAKLRPLPTAEPGVLDYELVNPTAGRWRVPVRVVPTSSGCYLAVTFTKPTQLTDSAFEASMRYAANGLATLKQVLEQAA